MGYHAVCYKICTNRTRVYSGKSTFHYNQRNTRLGNYWKKRADYYENKAAYHYRLK